MKRYVIYGLLLVFFATPYLGDSAIGAKAYPDGPIDFIVCYNPGGGSDITARWLAAYFAKSTGIKLNVINKTGGAGAIGLQAALAAKPNGYTMLMDTHGIGSMLALYKGTYPIDWRKRTWVCRISQDAMVYQVRMDGPYKTLKDVEAYIRKNPQALRWGTSGYSGASAAAGVQFLVEANIPGDMVSRVMFQGASKVLAALAGGHIDFASQQYSESVALIEAKKNRPIAVVSKNRLPLLPDVPTVAEAGYPNLDVNGYHGLSGPPGLPKHVVDYWVQAMEKASKDPVFIREAENLKKTVAFLGPKGFEDFVENEFKTYSELAKKGLGKKK